MAYSPAVSVQNKPNIESKLESVHPWADKIKDVFLHRYKYAHNSINNPIYPRKKAPPYKSQIKFTVIGDRVTKEFLYCTKLVQDLHKYRKNVFGDPVIRALNTVEWPIVLNDLKIKYRGLAFCLSSSVAVLINDTFLGGENELKKLVNTKYKHYINFNYYNESVAQFARYIHSSGRPCAYMNISINKKHIGCLIFMLYADIVPNTCENFLRLCKDPKGGYSGTPIHRIVKDGWIQCGGYGLKDCGMDCENFIVPHDRRGVIGMANAGRHMDCSTQFYVLLQPAVWMKHKFVAFGQLIEGKRTLEKIEAVSTWYESPNSEIVIHEAGVLNLNCHDFPRNKGVNEYVVAHVEDLYAFRELLSEFILERVFLTAQLRELERMMEHHGEGEHEPEEVGNLRATKRFIRNKAEIDKQLQTSKFDKPRVTSVSRPAVSPPSDSTNRRFRSPRSTKSQENKDFDVETYDPEDEEDETGYKHQSIPGTITPIVQPEIPFYIPLTDVIDPGEKDSNFDLKRFLKGDYCLPSDLQRRSKPLVTYPSDVSFEFEEEETESDELDTEEEMELIKFLEDKVDRVSFIGDVIKQISKTAYNPHIFNSTKQLDLITDDELRRLRLAAIDYKEREHREKKVSINMPRTLEHHAKIKRRRTGFVHPEDLQKLDLIRKLSLQAKRVEDDEDDDFVQGRLNDEPDEEFDLSDEDQRKVVISEPVQVRSDKKLKRRQTGFVRQTDLKKIQISLEDDHDMTARGANRTRDGSGLNEDEDDIVKALEKSVLHRLFTEVATTDVEYPTLKYYKPIAEPIPKIMYLKYSPNLCISDEEDKERHVRNSLVSENRSFEQLLKLQHGKKARKISSDYVQTIDQMEHNVKNSIRSVEYAKTRPAMTVADYQMKNKSYQLMGSTSLTTILDPAKNFEAQRKRTGIRLPGDSPVYSMIEIQVHDLLSN